MSSEGNFLRSEGSDKKWVMGKRKSSKFEKFRGPSQLSFWSLLFKFRIDDHLDNIIRYALYHYKS